MLHNSKTYEELSTMALTQMDKRNYESANVLAILAIGAATIEAAHITNKVNGEEFDTILNVALAANKFFTEPSDTAFEACSKALDHWDLLRGAEVHHHD